MGPGGVRYVLRTLDDMPQLGALLRQQTLPVVVTAQPEQDVRSAQANRYYWRCVVGGLQRWLESRGQTPAREAVHEYLKRERWGEDVSIINNRVIYTPRRTRNLSPAQFSEYVEWATAHVVELGAGEYMDAGEPATEEG